MRDRGARIFTNQFSVHSWNSWILILCFTAFPLFFSPAPIAQVHAPSQASDCATAAPAADPSPTVCISQVIVTTAGVSPDNHLSISWVSSNKETGTVKSVGIDSTYGDVRGPGFSGLTHYVQVSNLPPGADYQFDIISGGNPYTNDGQHWSVNIGPALNQPAPVNIIGQVKNHDGTAATEAILYAQVLRVSDSAVSSLVSMNPPMTADDQGVFHLSLSDARSLDSNMNFDGPFAFDQSKDKVIVTAVGAAGFASVTVPISAAKPHPGPFGVNLILGSGIVAYNTPTPTPIPPTLTATPVTPTATPTLLPLTATALAATQTATAFTLTPTLTEVPPLATLPRPTSTRPPPPIPSATVPIITIVPAGQTEVAQATLETTPDETAGPLNTRIIYPLTETPQANSLFSGVPPGGSLLAALALIAFIGAAVLGAAGIFIWRKK